MVQVMLEGFGGDHRKREVRKAKRPNPYGIECYHVNARVSRHLEDIGDFRLGKFILMLGYCVQAIWCRYRYGVTNLYYVPAPGKKSALYRDWLVMALCRPFYKRIILHWHASGLARWLETVVQVRSRSITYRLVGKVDLSVVLSNYGRADAEKLYPRSVAVVGNGLADPCPNFRSEVLPLRKARLDSRIRLMTSSEGNERSSKNGPLLIHKVLYLSHCSREKGLFEAITGVLLANASLHKNGSSIRMQLTLAGEFLNPSDREEFKRLMLDPATNEQVQWVGFAAGEQKDKLFRDADVFCFPSHLESFGLVLAEAMAYGLPMVATRCGALPEVVPPGYQGMVDVKSPEQVAKGLIQTLTADDFEQLREHYEKQFTMEHHLANLAQALTTAEQSAQSEASLLQPLSSLNKG